MLLRIYYQKLNEGEYMKSYPVIKKIITGSELASGECIFIKSKFEVSEYTLIKGYVSHNNEPIKNAAVIIICIDKTIEPVRENILGVVFTDENGVYGISIRVRESCEYKIEVYSSYNEED